MKSAESSGPSAQPGSSFGDGRFCPDVASNTRRRIVSTLGPIVAMLNLVAIYWTSDPFPISIGCMRVLITGDRFWECKALADRVVARPSSHVTAPTWSWCTAGRPCRYLVSPGMSEAWCRLEALPGRLEGPGEDGGAGAQSGNGRGRRRPVHCVASTDRGQQGNEGLRSPSPRGRDSGLADRR